MKFAFSTLGVPGMPIADVVRLAADTGYQGVELRAHPEEPVHLSMGMRERAAVVREFERAGVEILTVCGYARVAAADDDGPVGEELDELLWLAKDLGAPQVRVFPGGGDQDPATADAIAARRLGAAAETAAGLGVRILLETHDSHRSGAAVSRVLGPVGHKNAGAIWDVLHPWLAGEAPATTHAALSPFLGYVQVKDVASADDLTPLPLGAGVLPLAECLATLTEETWLCWEYEKRWNPGAAELPGLLAPGREHLEGLIVRRDEK
ncbi:sugar phosphate isomerase/epimerase [Streptomyces lunaelactis]|uniref:sugar phosphate isomerase/epimerase family protein n=1 Tax=Streptomyces lunaelactis TaxID=1535768 RepID=UPI001585B33A|nr:sugar phosphate isomerase/epimerase family protein [Streptomyces lunaelactis]NUK05777.1 sugar phosphate isomerase/epimerase [Streptomyces lunaelactis]NUK12442.1 sugar phosphate isomerase/epimerase [Streptomyces lunaelactis]NUK20270.1 sugar phosphate isomerase/epimerase [Streptomyces lunaelactis]NUK38785.1 sugar phosphate isomerase/epimerase [Streptomyces lunaelactis]NUK45860.1 sugar phosphate isomerase/epimerase [Streptomyces lunaelactis]